MEGAYYECTRSVKGGSFDEHVLFCLYLYDDKAGNVEDFLEKDRVQIAQRGAYFWV